MNSEDPEQATYLHKLFKALLFAPVEKVLGADRAPTSAAGFSSNGSYVSNQSSWKFMIETLE